MPPARAFGGSGQLHAATLIEIETDSLRPLPGRNRRARRIRWPYRQRRSTGRRGGRAAFHDGCGETVQHHGTTEKGAHMAGSADKPFLCLAFPMFHNPDLRKFFLGILFFIK